MLNIVNSKGSTGIRGFSDGEGWTSEKYFFPATKISETCNGENSSITHSHVISGGGSGKASGTAHENMPPYIVKYCWERVS